MNRWTDLSYLRWWLHIPIYIHCSYSNQTQIKERKKNMKAFDLRWMRNRFEHEIQNVNYVRSFVVCFSFRLFLPAIKVKVSECETVCDSIIWMWSNFKLHISSLFLMFSFLGDFVPRIVSIACSMEHETWEREKKGQTSSLCGNLWEPQHKNHSTNHINTQHNELFNNYDKMLFYVERNKWRKSLLFRFFFLFFFLLRIKNGFEYGTAQAFYSYDA